MLPSVVATSWDWLMVAAGSSSADCWEPTFPSSSAAVVVALKTVAAAETSEDCWLTASSRVSFRV